MVMKINLNVLEAERKKQEENEENKRIFWTLGALGVLYVIGLPMFTLIFRENANIMYIPILVMTFVLFSYILYAMFVAIKRLINGGIDVGSEGVSNVRYDKVSNCSTVEYEIMVVEKGIKVIK